MKAPAFWFAPPGPAAALLSPAAAVFALAGRRRRAVRPERMAVPVICVGNLTVGGTGKTPVVQSIVVALRRAEVDAQVLLRGYGGRLAGPLRVDPARHGADDVGDEALLHARIAPTWIARDRAAGAAAAIAAGARLIVLDDGFQNPHPTKDLSLVVVDGASGFGNGRVIPAGPLREAVDEGLARADAVVLMGEDRAGVRARIGGRVPVFGARLVPAPSALELRGEAVLAFAGIGRPAKFFDTLAALGARVVAAVAFADHHRYTEDEVMRICERAQALGARPVTTEKDAVRLPPGAAAMVRTVAVGVTWDDPAAVQALIGPLSARAADTAPGSDGAARTP